MAIPGSGEYSRAACLPTRNSSADFIVLFVADLERGRCEARREYLDLYPGCEAIVARNGTPPRVPARRRGRARPRAELAAATPRKLGTYRIERELGRGAQGTVFHALDTSLVGMVALKVLKTRGRDSRSWCGASSSRRRRSRASITRAIARSTTPGRSTASSTSRCVTSRARRSRARSRGRGGGRGRRRRRSLRYVALIEKAARALHVAHEAGLVHRDVKPGEPHDHAGRRARAPRLRPRAASATPRPRAHRDGRRPRDAGLHGAGADRRETGAASTAAPTSTGSPRPCTKR